MTESVFIYEKKCSEIWLMKTKKDGGEIFGLTFVKVILLLAGGSGSTGLLNGLLVHID